MSGSIDERHLEPHDLAEAPPPQLVLDRAQQVVGLVGDGEVGVARDPEVVVAQDLHAREELVEVAGDDRLERHERAVAERDEARQHLLRAPSRARRSRCRDTGSRSQTASDSDRFEM